MGMVGKLEGREVVSQGAGGRIRKYVKLADVSVPGVRGVPGYSGKNADRRCRVNVAC